MGLCNSIAQVALLAGLGGGICYCISAVSARAESSGRELSLPSQKGRRTDECGAQTQVSMDDPAFWPATTPIEEQECTTPLASLVADYIDRGMLEYLPALSLSSEATLVSSLVCK